GGNDPAVVLDDAVLDDAAISKMTNAILRAAGQVCIAIKRIYVHESRYDELVEKLSQSFARIVVGDGLNPETTMGPLNNQAQFDFVGNLLDECAKAGLEVSTQGIKAEPSTWNDGYFMLPSIILGAQEHHRIVSCEQFGPIVPIMPFTDEADAVM